MKASAELIKAVMVTAELMGTELSEPAARVIMDDLSAYPENQVMLALERCRRECIGRLKLADIISRIDDGRPGPEEAWSLCPTAEDQTVVWTEEIAEAFAVASPLIDDPVAARMAFKEAYTNNVTTARALQEPVKWVASLGHNPDGRIAPVVNAYRKGRLGADQAKKLLPNVDIATGKALPPPSLDQLEGPPGKRSEKLKSIARKAIAELKRKYPMKEKDTYAKRRARKEQEQAAQKGQGK